MPDRYTAKALALVTAPFWAMGLFLLAIVYIPWFPFVLVGLGIISVLVVVSVLVKDEAARMRSEVYRR